MRAAVRNFLFKEDYGIAWDYSRWRGRQQGLHFCLVYAGILFEEVFKKNNMIRKLKSGEYRIYSRKTDAKTGKRRNLGTFSSLEAAKKHEREIQAFKHRK